MIHPLSFVLIVLFLCPAPLPAQRLLHPALHREVEKGLDLILRQEYRLADSVFAELSRQFPDHPAGYLYQAAVAQTQSLDFGTSLRRDRFDSLLDRGRSACANLRDRAWVQFFLATADGYDAVARVDRGDWFGGIRKGLAAASEFRKLIEMDSGFVDAYAGVGTYLYWRSRKTEFLHWLPFISDDRPEGIELLERCALTGNYNRFAAVSSLISLFQDAGEYRRSEEWSRVGLKSYPGNRIFLWGLATALHRQERYPEAAAAYDTLLQSILLSRSPNPYNEIVCRLNLVRCALAVGRKSNVKPHLNAILSYEQFPFDDSFRDRVSEKFEEARRIVASF